MNYEIEKNIIFDYVLEDQGSISENFAEIMGSAARDGRSNVVKSIIAIGTDPNQVDSNGDAPIHQAIEGCSLDTVKVLLDEGADIHSKTDNGRTALHLAVKNNHTDIVKLLLEKKVDVNITDNSGKTPFHYAVEFADSEILKVLLEKKVNINITDNSGKTPLQYAVEFMHLSDLKVFEENKDKLDKTNIQILNQAICACKIKLDNENFSRMDTHDTNNGSDLSTIFQEVTHQNHR